MYGLKDHALKTDNNDMCKCYRRIKDAGDTPRGV